MCVGAESAPENVDPRSSGAKPPNPMSLPDSLSASFFDDLDTSIGGVIDTAMQGLNLYQGEEARREGEAIKFLQELPHKFEVRELLALGAAVSLWDGPLKDESWSRGEVTLCSFQFNNLVIDLEKEEFRFCYSRHGINRGNKSMRQLLDQMKGCLRREDQKSSFQRLDEDRLIEERIEAGISAFVDERARLLQSVETLALELAADGNALGEEEASSVAKISEEWNQFSKQMNLGWEFHEAPAEVRRAFSIGWKHAHVKRSHSAEIAEVISKFHQTEIGSKIFSLAVNIKSNENYRRAVPESWRNNSEDPRLIQEQHGSVNRLGLSITLNSELRLLLYSDGVCALRHKEPSGRRRWVTQPAQEPTEIAGELIGKYMSAGGSQLAALKLLRTEMKQGIQSLAQDLNEIQQNLLASANLELGRRPASGMGQHDEAGDQIRQQRRRRLEELLARKDDSEEKS